MSAVIQPFLAFLSTRILSRKGQTLVEYALVLAVISIVLISVFSLLSARLVVIFSAITNLLDTAQQGSH